jgi:general secretion pathway protein G
MAGCRAVRSAAVLYQNLDGTSDLCPTMQNLVQAKRRADFHTVDPWGSEYRIDCASGDIRVYSNGNDRRPGTADDLRDDFTPVEIQQVREPSK